MPTDPTASSPTVVNPAQTTGNLPVFRPSAEGGSQIQKAVSMQVDQRGMVAIATAAAETQIRKEVSVRKAAVQAASAAFNAATKAIADYQELWLRGQFDGDTPLQTFLKATKALVPSTTVEFGTTEYNRRSQRLSGCVTLQAASKFQYIHEFSEPADKDYQALLTTLESTTKALDEAQRLLMASRAALNNVDALERQAEAALARQAILKSGDEGADLVKAIEGTVNAGNLIDLLGS